MVFQPLLNVVSHIPKQTQVTAVVQQINQTNLDSVTQFHHQRKIVADHQVFILDILLTDFLNSYNSLMLDLDFEANAYIQHNLVTFDTGI